MSLVHVDGTQDEEAMLERSKLEEPLHFKTTSTSIIVSHDVKDYPNVALAVIIRARRGDAPLEVGIGDQEEYSSDEGLNIPELDKVARVARNVTKEIEKENAILHDRQRPNVIHDLEGSDIGEWEGPGIPLDEFDGVGNTKVEKSSGYDLWADLSSLKADITFGQLLEISPVARKTLKDGMPVNRRAKKVK